MIQSMAVKRLLKDYGIRGYGIFRYIENTLWGGSNKFHHYKDIEVLAYEIQENVEDVTKIVMEYGLFLHDNIDNTFAADHSIE
jgi:HD superfamily phosphodiesterase